MLIRVFEEMFQGAIVHFRFYLKYFEYFQLKNSQDGSNCLSFSQKSQT